VPVRKSVSLSRQLLVFAVCVLVAAALWLARDQITGFGAGLSDSKTNTGKKGGNGVPVILAAVTSRADDETLTSVGTARARRSVTITARAEGTLIRLPLPGGGRIDKGEVLFEQDKTKAELAVALAQEKLNVAENNLQRAEQLRKRGTGSLANVQDAEFTAAQARVELRQARETLAELTFRAPFSGHAGIPKVEVGDWLKKADEVMSFDQRSELLIGFDVPEQYAARLKPGDDISARTPAHPGKTFNGRIEQLDSRINETSRAVMVRAVIDNKQDLLRPGMSFAVELTFKGKSYPSVPELALQWRQGESYVWTVTNGKAKKVVVRSVRRSDNRVLVDGALKPGDQVVVEGVQRLRDGRAVSLADKGGKPVEAQGVRPAAQGAGKG
jgi:RND family efflux transporter MFP subunit